MSAQPLPRIMVVDDSTTIRDTAKKFLSSAYEVIPVDDGFKCLAAVQAAKPDLLLLDIMMPKLNGYQALQLIRANPDFATLPIVFLSGKDGPFDKSRGSLMGCDDYLVKPFERQELLDVVARHLRR
jgi:twitching motility two-component system response regulator PilG